MEVTSSVGVGKVADADAAATAYLGWQDLCVSSARNLRGNGNTKKLLNALTGFAQPHRLMAIMGPSGSGKST
ncbi:hypothetical protein PTKIN_Ptkin06aG0095800 [Pterospermum kingtungense]